MTLRENPSLSLKCLRCIFAFFESPPVLLLKRGFFFSFSFLPLYFKIDRQMDL